MTPLEPVPARGDGAEPRHVLVGEHGVDPHLGLWQAAVNNQTSTTVANTMPGGGYVSIAVSYEMYRAWGFSKTDVGLRSP